MTAVANHTHKIPLIKLHGSAQLHGSTWESALYALHRSMARQYN